jgi:hypothetical protein
MLMMRESLNFPVVRRRIISENQFPIPILIMIRIFIHFDGLFNVYEFYEMEHRLICEEKLTLNDANVQRTLILEEAGLDNMNTVRDLRFNLLKNIPL